MLAVSGNVEKSVLSSVYFSSSNTILLPLINSLESLTNA